MSEKNTKHRIKKVIMLKKKDIENRRKNLEKQYGTEQSLKEKRIKGTINTDELLALQRFDDLDYLEYELFNMEIKVRYNDSYMNEE